jgi:hypothetical protein
MSLALRHVEPAPQAIPPGVAMLRVLAPACRVKARLDLFQACAMLAMDRDQAAQAYADALIRTLHHGLGHAPVLHRAGTEELSFDEKWLTALFDAQARGDDASFAFLIRRRLARTAARQIGFLVASLARRLPV